MRIVAGAARGRRLVAPRGEDTRPTADRVKEALFASLQPMLSEARVLDLYAGSGSLGLEALSRGAASVTLVETHRKALEAIERNVEAVALPGATVRSAPVSTVLADELPEGPFDLVFVDPPYRLPTTELDTVLHALEPHLADGAIVVVERGRRDDAPSWPARFTVDDPRRYGDTILHRAELGPA
jgi:16S rRNA (guanine966-N2)-methyltransferase